MEITLIAAFDKNYAIGRKGELPWHLSSDLKHFKKITSGNAIIMGRKTFESIGKPLPNRDNYVLTKNINWTNKDVFVIHSPDLIYKISKDVKEVFVIGGGEIYEAFMPIASKMILSYVNTEVEDADAYFPNFSEDNWMKTKESESIKEDNDEFDYKILIFKRIK
ncbi:MAG: dihydrofolate reductase [Methanobacteriota archaeon]|nr:MAG: dihydrofolate reductase [Euryarchaeota archaeon]|tara:strand:- start:13212 stop:13703 length:492 start_codon:yes stop_codon:yes gene_type:complete